MATGSDGPIDPTANVLQLVEAAIIRQDDLREADSRHAHELNELRASYQQKLREAETARIDAIRAVDVGAVTVLLRLLQLRLSHWRLRSVRQRRLYELRSRRLLRHLLLHWRRLWNQSRKTSVNYDVICMRTSGRKHKPLRQPQHDQITLVCGLLWLGSLPSWPSVCWPLRQPS